MIIHIRDEISEFDANFTDNSAAATIRFETTSKHQATVTIPREILGDLAARLNEMISYGDEPISIKKASDRRFKLLKAHIFGRPSQQADIVPSQNLRAERSNEIPPEQDEPAHSRSSNG